MRRLHLCLSIMIFLPLALWAQGGKDYGEFAPPDAYIDDSGHAYYGSENEWSRRMFSERAASRFYKRRGQRQMLAILDGHPERAAQLCRGRIKQDPQDAESLFVLAVALAQLDSLQQALQATQRALDVGLPFERFLAGPRSLLAPLTATSEFAALHRQHPVQLLHGPLLGAVTDSSARFWARTRDPVRVQVRVRPASGPGEVQLSSVAKTHVDRDFTAVVEVIGLQPTTLYSYDILLEGEPVLQANQTVFQTFPASGRPATFEIGFGGGAGYTPANERIWEVIASHRLTAFLLLGDNVYIDLPEQPGAFHQYTYYRRQSRPEFRRLVRRTPIFAIWDDHDAAIDDIWMGPYRDKPDWKPLLFRIFQINWNNPAYGDSYWQGCWFTFSIADVDFIMLDGRMYRSNPFMERPTMLGAVQKQWLKRTLLTSSAMFKVLVSPVPWAPGAKPNSKDTWDGFAAEREEIFSFIETNDIDGVILMSADRHRSEAWKHERPNSHPLYEFLSSKLTNIHTHDIVPGALFSYNEKCSFGVLAFDTNLTDPTVTFRVYSIDDELIDSLTIRRSELSR